MPSGRKPGFKISEETRERMRQAKSVISTETRLKMSAAKKGRKIPKEHREKMLKTLRSPEHRQKMSEITKAKGEWGWQKNPFKWNKNKSVCKKENSRRRRERNKNAPGSHTIGEWETLKAQYNWTCPCCKAPESEKKLTKDHIVALSKGGSNNIENIQPLCLRCNAKKHTDDTFYPPDLKDNK